MKISIQKTTQNEVTSLDEVKALLDDSNLEVKRISDWNQKEKFKGAMFVISAKDESKRTEIINFKEYPRSIAVYSMLYTDKDSARISIITKPENGLHVVEKETFFNKEDGSIQEARFGTNKYKNLIEESQKHDPKIFLAKKPVATLTNTNLYALQAIIGVLATEDDVCTIEQLSTRPKASTEPTKGRKLPSKNIREVGIDEIFEAATTPMEIPEYDVEVKTKSEDLPM